MIVFRCPVDRESFKWLPPKDFARFCSLALVVFGLVSHSIGSAQESKPGTPAEKPKTVSLAIGSVQSDVVFNVSLAPSEASEVAVDFKILPNIKISEIVQHGSAVKAGDTLVSFDTQSLLEQIDSQERLVASLRLGLEESEREFKLSQLQLPLDKELAEITKQQADEDYKYFLEFEKAFAEKSNEQRLKSSKDAVDYAAEEVKQLEKMYKADDLTEESEEIVLRRAKDDLDRQKFGLEQSESFYRRSKELTLPRSIRDRKAANRLAEIALERFQMTNSIGQDKRMQGLAKSRQELIKANKTLEQLREDLQACEVKSPRAGIVYYGRVQSGKWSGTAELRNRLKKYGSVLSHEVFVTVVNPESLQLVGNVAEANFSTLRVGGAGKLTPTTMKNERVDVVVHSITPIPVSDGQFEVTLNITNPKKELVAGMTGSVRVITYFNPRASTLPTSVVLTDDLDDTIKYVYVMNVESKSVRKNVETGVTQDDRVEIRSGIDSTEAILLEKPKTE